MQTIEDNDLALMSSADIETALHTLRETERAKLKEQAQQVDQLRKEVADAKSGAGMFTVELVIKKDGTKDKETFKSLEPVPYSAVYNAIALLQQQAAGCEMVGGHIADIKRKQGEASRIERRIHEGLNNLARREARILSSLDKARDREERESQKLQAVAREKPEPQRRPSSMVEALGL